MPASEEEIVLSPLSDWLPNFSSGQILELVGARAWTRARSGASNLEGEPVDLAGEIVQGRVREQGAAFSVKAGLRLEGPLVCHCECAAFRADPPCGHVAGLLLTLANDQNLRSRLSGPSGSGTQTTDSDSRESADTAKQRHAAQEVIRRRGIDLDGARLGMAAPKLLDVTFRGWHRRGSIRPLGPATFHLSVEYDASTPEEPPLLHVVVVCEQPRRNFGPDDLESRRLPSAEWRLFEPLGRPRNPGPGFVASADAACTFLERALAAGLELQTEEPESVEEITNAVVRPALQMRPASADEHRHHSAVIEEAADKRRLERELHEAWVAYKSIVEPIEEERFLSLLGVPLDDIGDQPGDTLLVEAQWVSAEPDGGPSYLPLPSPLTQSVLFRGARSWVFLRDSRRFARVAPDVGPIALARLIEQPTILLGHDETPELPALLTENFLREGISIPTRESLGLAPLPRPHIVLRVGGSVFAAQAHLEARYEDHKVDLGPETYADAWDNTRNAESERSAIDAITATSLRLDAPARRRRKRPNPEESEPPTFRAEGEHAVQFWTRELPEIVARAGHGGAIDEAIIPADLKNVRVREPVASRLESQSSGDGLLAIALSFASEGVAADVQELRAAMEAKRRWVKLTDGSVASFSGRVADLASATTDRLGPDGTAQLNNHALGELRMWSELADEVSADETLNAWTGQLRALEVKPTPEPVLGLTATLRSYQKIGLAWLQFLSELNAGGILADDMGLGKTVQALALLAWRRERDGPAPSLVVAPTSVASNWIREAQRFVPGLRTLLLHGASRHSRRDDVPSSDIVVTTYSLLRRDIQSLKGVNFRYVILDEAQHIKNHAAATTAAARSLSSQSRLALTGTPLENRLLELWSIVDFVNPGMLGNWREFSRRWERPVTQGIEESGPNPGTKSSSPVDPASNAAAQSLRERIRPFLLRRTKAEVERDLPPKIESDVVVDLTPAQKRAYAALAKATREDLGKRMETDGLDKSRMVVLTALLRLRQMACDPRLVDSKHSAQDSAKLEALRELVAEVIASGRRALVFSQFVQLLTLVREEFDEKNIGYAYLDGRTRDRDAEIEKFVNGSMPVFLLSLRAGGTGINLAAADVVIHLDPWWNPAVEDQATDRVHRIGQKKTVSVYRIIAAGTIEEAILRLKSRKRALAKSVVGNAPEGLPPGLTEDDIADLLGG